MQHLEGYSINSPCDVPLVLFDRHSFKELDIFKTQIVIYNRGTTHNSRTTISLRSSVVSPSRISEKSITLLNVPDEGYYTKPQ